MIESAIIWSYSCSTGEGGKIEGNLASMLHQAFERKVIASKNNFSLDDITINYDNEGRIEKITIKNDDNTVIFEK